MQPPDPDQQIQYTSPQYQQLQQPIMLCPVQYVYEQLLPDEQGQLSPAYQSQAYLLNVQQTPPWAQTQPNMIYMQHPNIQPYMQPVIQNPVYNYQYQPMIVQEQRQVPSYMNQSVMNPQIQQQLMNVPQNQIMQVQNQMVQNVQNQIIPNVAHNQVIQNVAQNPHFNVQNQVNQNQINPNIIQNQIRFQMEKRETPILASMLNVRKPLHQNEIVSIMRPQYQNVRQQMIILNPIAKHTCVHSTQRESPVLIDKQQKDIDNIRSQVPEGLSVKTIKVPATGLVNPNENILQNFAPTDEIPILTRVNNQPRPVYNRDTQTNYKRKLIELLELSNRDGNEVLAKIMCPANKPDELLFKAQVSIDTPPNTSEIQTNNSTVNTQMINVKAQAEEKKLRNTVFVQARGRVDDVRVNDIQNVNYTNISNVGTGIANIMINNKNIENFNESVVLNNENLDLNTTNNEHFNIVVVNNNNVMHNNVNFNNQSVERIGSEININNIGNLEIPMQIQMQTENNKTKVNFDNQFISEQVVRNMKVTTREEKIPSLEVVVIENNRQDTVKLAQTITSNNGEKTMVKNTGQNEDLTQIITTENNSTIKKLLATEIKTRKSKKTKVPETNMTQYKSTITNVPQTANNEALNNSNDLQRKLTLIPKHPTNLEEEDSVKSKSKSTDMSMTKIDISSDTNQNNVTNVKITDDAKETRKKKKLKNKTKLAKNEVDKKNENKSEVTKIDKPKKDKKKMVDTKLLVKEPVAMYVLTHVLDGHIIQESNVPFLVQKPSLLPQKEKPMLREERVEINEMTEENIEERLVETKDNTVKDSIPVETENTVEDRILVETKDNIDTSKRVETKDNIEVRIQVATENEIGASIRVETEASSSTDTERDKVEDRNKEFDKPDTSAADEDNPFKGLSKDIVEAWTISDVTSHLIKYDRWRDTALTLADQEVDGESLLLASKDQLLQIDICEEQAQEISEFLEQVQ